MKLRLVHAAALIAFVALMAHSAWADSPPRERRWQQIQEKLGLSAEQLAQVQPILQSYRRQRRERLDTLANRLRETLTPEQQMRFDALRAEHGQSRAASSPERRRHGFRELITSLQLSPQQIVTVQRLARETMQQARAAHDALLDQIRPLLTPDQFARFQELTRRQRGGEGD